MKLGVFLVALFSLNVLYGLFFGGSWVSIGHYLFYTAMIIWGIIRIMQATRKKYERESEYKAESEQELKEREPREREEKLTKIRERMEQE
jgi:hypothetical protein